MNRFRVISTVATTGLATAMLAVVTTGAVTTSTLAVAPISAVSGFSSSDAALASASYPTVSGLSTTRLNSYKISQHFSGKPVRWNPCAAIRWTYNPKGAPANGLAAVSSAVSKVSRASGIRFVYVGTSTATPNTAYLAKTARAVYPPVLIGWTNAAGSDMLRNQPAAVVGMARNAWFGMGTTAANRAGVIALDNTDRKTAVQWDSITQHELSHVLGLGHTSDSTQLLAPVLSTTAMNSGLQAGDQNGLKVIGISAGCITLPAGI